MFMRESPDTNETALLMQFSRFWCWFTNSEDINDYVSRLFRALHNRFFQPPPFFFFVIFLFFFLHYEFIYAATRLRLLLLQLSSQLIVICRW